VISIKIFSRCSGKKTMNLGVSSSPVLLHIRVDAAADVLVDNVTPADVLVEATPADVPVDNVNDAAAADTDDAPSMTCGWPAVLVHDADASPPADAPAANAPAVTVLGDADARPAAGLVDRAAAAGVLVDVRVIDVRAIAAADDADPTGVLVADNADAPLADVLVADDADAPPADVFVADDAVRASSSADDAVV